MSQERDMFRQIMREITDGLTENLSQVLSDTLERQLSESLTSALVESEFYRRLNSDMRDGLRRIYKEANAAQDMTAEDKAMTEKQMADKLFHDASEQLAAVLQQTEDVTNKIMSMVERQMEFQAESATILNKGSALRLPDYLRLTEINTSLGEDLLTLMTAMSFQDLTGQRIKKAVAAIKQLESTVLELYVSSGLMLKAYEKEPLQNLDELEQQTKAVVADITQKVIGSELKGPTDKASQGDIDALLAEFGL